LPERDFGLAQLLIQTSEEQIVQTAERIIGTTLPTLQDLYSSRVRNGAGKIPLTSHIQATSSLKCCHLQSTEYLNSQTKERVLSSGHLPY